LEHAPLDTQQLADTKQKCWGYRRDFTIIILYSGSPGYQLCMGHLTHIPFVKPEPKPVSDVSFASLHMQNLNQFGLNLANRFRNSLVHETDGKNQQW